MAVSKKFGVSLVAGTSHYAPDAHGATYRRHGLDQWVLNLTLEGMGRINTGENSFTASPGDILLFPPRIVHDYSWEPGPDLWIHHWIYFSPLANWAPLLNWPRRGGSVLGFPLHKGEVHDNVRGAMERCLRMFRSPHQARIRFCTNALEEALLWCDVANPFSSGSIGDPRIQAALAFMLENFASDLTVAAIARECALSPSRFAHLFQAETGQPPARYLDSLRIWKAQELLLGGAKSVKEVSNEVGYRDPLYFSRVFRQKVGMNPRMFRQDSRRSG
jgi:AraC family transcriptional regulator of arabinose operon